MDTKPLIRQNFTIFIKAPVKKVWDSLLEKESYKYWTSEFEPTSSYEGEMKLGNIIKFKSEEGVGVIGKVVKFDKYKMIGFGFNLENDYKDNINSYQALIKEGVEEYYFEEKDGGTQLSIIVDNIEEWAKSMEKSWQKALLKLKELSESQIELKYITPLKVNTQVNCDISKVWKYFTIPAHIEKWSYASEDWACKDSKVDLKIGGKFSSYLYALDGSFGFEFSGFYTEIEINSIIKYTLDDNRKVIVKFEVVKEGNITNVNQFFEPEYENSLELQKSGWQAFLDNFKKYCEEN
jgi:uncharacterized protein YndB with AHSA1/START domain